MNKTTPLSAPCLRYFASAALIVILAGCGAGSGAPASDSADPVGSPPMDPAPPNDPDPPPPDPGPQIEIAIVQPSFQLGQYDDVLEVIADIESEFQIDAVTAGVSTVETTMAYSEHAYDDRNEPADGWVGSLDLSALARGSYLVEVKVTDVNGDASSLSREFVLNSRPVLTVEAPLNELAVTNPLPVRAGCTDDEGYCRIQVFANGSEIAAADNVFDASVQLPDSFAGWMELRVSATDGRDRSLTQALDLYLLDSNTLLVREVDAGDRVRDADDTRVLYGIDVHGNGPLFVLDRPTGDITQVDLPPGSEFGSYLSAAYLTPTGFWVRVETGSVNVYALYEWRDGSLTPLVTGWFSGPAVAGDYGVWAKNGVVHRRRFSTDELLEVTSEGDVPNVADNGVVVFARTNELLWYEQGAISSLVSYGAGDTWAQSPATDGSAVAYLRTDGFSPDELHTVAVTEGPPASPGMELLLSQPSPEFLDGRIRNGWVAYADPGNAGQLNLWRRAPDGTTSQVSFFGGDADLEALAEDGQIVLSHDGVWYLSRPADPPGDLIRIGRQGGQVRYRDGQFFFFIGRSVFTLE